MTGYPYQIKTFLENKYQQYNRPEFIDTDPIQVPHEFSDPYDIEIAGFFTAILAWGHRKTIIRKSRELTAMMGNKPYDFIMNAGEKDYQHLGNFCHRTFNLTDTLYFMQSLKNIYSRHGGLQKVFEEGFGIRHEAGPAIMHFNRVFFEGEHPERTRKHIPDIRKGSAAKRINMFLRWMVRDDNMGVDFGIWKKIRSAWLSIPLDLHTGITARKLGLLQLKQNNWKAVGELTDRLRTFDPEDPVKYDFALFGLSALDK